jgi:aryl-alcohol dehydrogenase-like predicted oxidoreductase
MPVPEDNIRRIGLGTVQFGLDYGISNPKGKVSMADAALILERANRVGITMLDTAASYGDSEKVLGNIIKGEQNFWIVTKTPGFDSEVITEYEADRLEGIFDRSLEKLKKQKVYALLIHRVADLFKPGGELLVQRMKSLKSEGKVDKIGVSVYTAKEIEQVLNRFTPDIVQLPFSVFDQRLLAGGWLRRLKEIGVEIHCRSVFLQGLLLMKPEDIDPYFAPVKAHMKAYREMLKDNEITPLQAALWFLLHQNEIDTVMAGVCSVKELEEIYTAVIEGPAGDMDFAGWKLEDERFLNPALWRLVATGIRQQR